MTIQQSYRFTQRNLTKLLESARKYEVDELDVVKKYFEVLRLNPDSDLKRHHERAYNETGDYILFEK